MKEYSELVKENEELFFKLAGVMHFVDKWLDDDELNLDEVNRADRMREKTLQIIEKLENHQQKYRWHDLRENPDDLPNDGVFVSCEWVGSSHNWVDTFIFCKDPKPHFINSYGTYISIIGTPKYGNEGQVIAWRVTEFIEDQEDAKNDN